jgi:predicted RNA binding protein YcfA (HicA-like mRNA interferase family)
MKSYSSYELIRILETDGWCFHKANGSHHHFVHPSKKGKVTIPHPKKDLPSKTVKSILRQAGIDS